MSRYFVLGAGIALPIVGVMLIIDTILGVLVKSVPQMNIFVVGMPAKVFIGLLVMFITAPLLHEVFNMLMVNTDWLVIEILQWLQERLVS